jgi:type II secretory pathway component HofQ
MKRTLILTALLGVLLTASPFARAQSTLDAPALPSAVETKEEKVSISSRGHDIRTVLYDLFTQSNRNFVLDSGVRYVLYLNLKDVKFEEALHIVLKQAELGYETRNGIVYIGRNRPKPWATTPSPTPTPVNRPQAPAAKPGTTPAPTVAPANRTVTARDLQRRVTTRLTKTDLRVIFAEFQKQTGITIEVDPAVPELKADAFLINTSLKYALDVLTDAARLTYRITDKGTILISPRPATSKSE